MVFRTVVVARIRPGSEEKVGDVFGHYDRTTRPQDLGVIGRSLLSLHDLYIHVVERNVDPKVSGQRRGLPAFQKIAEQIAPYVTPYPRNWQRAADSVAKEFYRWVPPRESASEVGPEDRPEAGPRAGPADGGNLTVIVSRMRPNAEPEIARIFGEADAGPLPTRTGITGRWLYSIDDVYLHLLERGDDAAFAAAMRRAHQDPAFTRMLAGLRPYLSPYRPESWRSHEDAVAREFYRWRADG